MSKHREARELEELLTPAAIVDLDRMERNLDRMAEYVTASGLGLRPHTKTHKTPELAAEQLRRGAIGVTVATLREAEVMSTVADDILIAYPPVTAAKLKRVAKLRPDIRLTVAGDSAPALRGLSSAAELRGQSIGVLIEIDAGMRLWYESCSCCLSDAHPEIKAALDAEREAAAEPPVDAGICEVAEAAH